MGSSYDADVIVIGSGPGGLTCAAYLAAAGKRVLVFERHFVAGGNATTFTHHGYEFDVGLHYVGECHPGGVVPSLLEPLGVDDITFRELDPDGFDTLLFPDGFEFRFPKGLEALRHRLHSHFPNEQRVVDSFLGTVSGLNDALYGMSEATSLAGLAKMPPRVARIALNYRATLGGLLDRLRPSRRLRSVLEAHSGLYAVAPSRASLILHSAVLLHYEHGAFNPEGGGQVISDRLVDVVRANGGEVMVRTPVEQVIVEGGRVRGVRVRPPAPARHAGAREEYRAPVVVSNADLKRTYFELVGEENLPSRVVERARRYRMAPPIFVLYLVLDRDLRAEGMPNTNWWAMSDDIEEMYRAAAAGRLPEDPWAFVCSGSMKDPANERAARPGQTNIQVMTVAPADYPFWGLHDGPHAGERYRKLPAYLDRKLQYQDALLTQAERAIPGLRESIAYAETASPMTHERFTASTGGTSYGFECTPDQFLMGRPRPNTPIEGLFLTGANTMFGHGIVATMLGGAFTASMVEGQLPFGDGLKRRIRETQARRQRALVPA